MNTAQRNQWGKLYRQRNRDRIHARVKKWQKDNPEKTKANQKRYESRNAENIAEYRRIYAWAFPEKALARVKKYQKKNLDKIKERIRQSRHAVNETRRRTYHANPNSRLRDLLRGRVKKAIRALSGKQSQKTMELIGCSIPDLMLYLESKFESGMNWENYGSEWHIDHIMPCAIFDLTKPEHQRRCFHFSNMQPLWAQDNLRKNAKVLSNQFPLI